MLLKQWSWVQNLFIPYILLLVRIGINDFSLQDKFNFGSYFYLISLNVFKMLTMICFLMFSSQDAVIRKGEELLKKKASSANLDDPNLMDKLFLLFNGVGCKFVLLILFDG